MSSASGDTSDRDACTVPFSLSSVLTPAALFRARRYVDLLSSPRLLESTTKASNDPEMDSFVEVMQTLRSAAADHEEAQREFTTKSEAASSSWSPADDGSEREHDKGSDGTTTTLLPHRGVTHAADALRLTAAASSAFSPLRALREAFGDTDGSALHRTWLETPQRYLSQLTRLLQRAVLTQYVRRFWPAAEPTTAQHDDKMNTPGLTAAHTALSGVTAPLSSSSSWTSIAARYEQIYDVHVQWLPSSSAAQYGARSAAEVVAVVLVRRRDALARLAAEEARTAHRYLTVAAPGQTVESALRFWSDVALPDRPRGEEAAFDPLGFDTASRLAQERLGIHTNASALEDGEGGEETEAPEVGRAAARSTGRKRTRESTGMDTTIAPTVVLGAAPSVTLTSTAVPADGSASLWRQPSVLVAPTPPLRDTSTPSSPRPSKAKSNRQGPRRVRHSRVGLVAVLYVTLRGVAYVGFADSLSGTGTTTTVTLKSDDQKHADRPDPQPAPPAMPFSTSTMATPRPSAPVQCVPIPQALLPLESKDSFTRGLLRL